ncbi:MAG TPA: mycofactocin-coupled SDR family oxidoreductase [Pseudonocardia sp.]|jgi:SDR family mycofactocin-dependent oxidoreductase
MTLLPDKVAFITGVARGQGRSHALRLAEEGADIIGVDICADFDTIPYPMATEDDLKQTVADVEALDRRILTARVDVRDRAALTGFVADAAARLGRLDVVVANAGISALGTKAEMDDVWQDVLQTNLTGVFNTVQAALPAMIEGGRGGSIILTSSTAGLVGLTLGSAAGYAYTAAKHGVVGLMRGYARDLARHSIRVNTVHPTGVATDMILNPAIEEFFGDQPEATATLVNLLPVEMIEARDISNAIVWLASDQARYVTGVALPVDAGFTIK